MFYIGSREKSISSEAGYSQEVQVKELRFYQQLALEMVQRDSQRDQMLAAMDRMWRGEWRLPPQMADLRWVHKVVSTDPHDALRAGTRVLSSVEPRISLQLLGGEAGENGGGDELERALGWLFRCASRRRRASVLRDVVLSALLYDEVVAQVVYLPHQIAALRAFDGDTRRLEAAGRYGPFAVLVRNPRQVHVRYSDWMPEAVLLKRVMATTEALDFWGKKAGRLRRALDDKRAAEKRYLTLYDYMDLEVRVVWAMLQQDSSILSPPLADEGAPSGGIELLREEHRLGFLPWVAKVGGTTLVDDPAHQRIPLLYAIYQTDQWSTQNILETLMASEAIAYAAAPRLKVEGPSDAVQVDYGEPGRTAYVPPGHDLNPLDPPQMDNNLAAIADRVGERIGKSTVPRVLQSGDYPGGIAYSTLNLATQSGIKSLAPYKELAEQALADMLMHMLYWIDHSGEVVVSLGSGRDVRGRRFSIDPALFDVDKVFIEVELTADVPSDRMARINAGALAVQQLGYSRARALEQVGENDPQVIMQEARQEELDLLELEIEKQRRLAAAGLQPMGRAGSEKGASANGLSGGSGQGFNPALGGTPPVTAAPGLSHNGVGEEAVVEA